MDKTLLISITPPFTDHHDSLTKNIASPWYLPSKIVVAEKLHRSWCSSNALILYQLCYLLHRNVERQQYNIQYTPELDERINMCGAYVAWYEGGWHFQQHLFYLQTYRFYGGWVHQGIEKYPLYH